MVLCGITGTDNEVDIDYLVPKILKTKLWGVGDKPWATSVVDMGFQILFVSQFTLYHQLKGTRPDFHDAAEHEQAHRLYEIFLKQLEVEYQSMRQASKEAMATPSHEKYVWPGSFGNHMLINQTNDGPVTLVIDSVKDAKAVKKYEAIKLREAKSKKGKQESQDTTEETKEETKEEILESLQK